MRGNGNIQLINNSDKGSGNTLQSSSQATGKNQKSTVSECVKPRKQKERKRSFFSGMIIQDEMNILIITTFFPPDTAIAAVRPYMFAKYLALRGYNVTVLRSGEINSMADDSLINNFDSIRVFSYLGKDSAAERFARGEKIYHKESKSRFFFLPKFFRQMIGVAYHSAFTQNEFKLRMKRINKKAELQKKFLNSLKERGEVFDIVFSTYGDLENVFAGEYAAKRFKCKYILDFRDLIAQKTFFREGEFRKLLKIQKEAMLSADICTCVSACSSIELQKQVPGRTVVTLYNGYEPLDQSQKPKKIQNFEMLTFCYTGQLYAGKRDATPLFHALSDNCKEGRMDKNNLKFYYAGKDFSLLVEQAQKYDMESILVDMGYLNRQEIIDLQLSVDVFTVLSWNTHESHGILTGKFYEGIRSRKPILALVNGNEKESELKGMNNAYNYGFCYEVANPHDFVNFKEWLLGLYHQKKSSIELRCEANPNFFDDFRYDNLTKKLEEIITSLIYQNDPSSTTMYTSTQNIFNEM